MPRRTNVFQETVAILHGQLASGQLEESAMLVSTATGELREVDAVIRTKIAGYEIVIGIEATSSGRRATVEWVERMLGKHSDLPTDKLILASQAGFTETARMRALAHGAVPLVPEDFDEGDPVGEIVNHLNSLWSKYVTLTPERASAWVETGDRVEVEVVLEQGRSIYLENGGLVGSTLEVVLALLNAKMRELFETTFRDVASDADPHFLVEMSGPTAGIDGVRIGLWLASDDGSRFDRIKRLAVWGQAHVQVREVVLQHARLGDVGYSAGTARIGDRDALLVVSEHEGDRKLTLRVRPAIGGKRPS